MSNYKWIISDYKFHKQKSYKNALKEMARLQAKHPEKTFRIYRVHNIVKPGEDHLPKGSLPPPQAPEPDGQPSSAPIPPTKITLANFRPVKPAQGV